VHSLRVARIDRLTHDAVAVELEVPPELRDAFEHRAGQHVVVLHARGDEVVRRTYSICTAASSGELRIGVKAVPDGAFSEFANRTLREGDMLQVMVPSGSFGATFDSTAAKSYGLVAAGSGITPILSIAASALEQEPLSRVTLLYGNRTRASVMFRSELDALRELYGSRLSVVHVLSREDTPGSPRGRIRPELLDVTFRVDQIENWFLCGPEPLLEEMTAALRASGVADVQIHCELFHGSHQDPIIDGRPDITSEVSLRLNGEQTRLRIQSTGEPILTAALAAHADLPYACQEAVCATCRAKVVEGEVVMDRCSALDRHELANGYVLACQAHPITPVVVLDFDA
jgi:ring-1,2-phenylacetyl-CoA epoxidase subunit PaaE